MGVCTDTYRGLTVFSELKSRVFCYPKCALTFYLKMKADVELTE